MEPVNFQGVKVVEVKPLRHADFQAEECRRRHMTLQLEHKPRQCSAIK